MGRTLIILIILTLVTQSVVCQIDTIKIHHQLEGLKSFEQHKKFWETIYTQDQKYRGGMTNDSIDKVNLIKSCMYLNKYGFPKRNSLGNESEIISIVWIHNRYPGVDLLTFPIIMEGFKAKEISLSSFKEYYCRGIYNRKFEDDDYIHLSVPALLKKIEPNIKRPININEVLNQFEKEETFLEAEYQELGVWKSKPRYDTLYHNGNPIINAFPSGPIRIFIDKENNYYFHKLFNDRSHFPQLLTKISNSPLQFHLFKDAKSYIEILENGTLKIVEKNGDSKEYFLENPQQHFKQKNGILLR